MYLLIIESSNVFRKSINFYVIKKNSTFRIGIHEFSIIVQKPFSNQLNKSTNLEHF